MCSIDRFFVSALRLLVIPNFSWIWTTLLVFFHVIFRDWWSELSNWINSELRENRFYIWSANFQSKIHVLTSFHLTRFSIVECDQLTWLSKVRVWIQRRLADTHCRKRICRISCGRDDKSWNNICWTIVMHKKNNRETKNCRFSCDFSSIKLSMLFHQQKERAARGKIGKSKSHFVSRLFERVAQTVFTAQNYRLETYPWRCALM